MNSDEFKYELLKSFHQQFAQNQNHNQNLFIQVLSILLTVMIGFGYTLFNFKTTNPNQDSASIGLFEFSIAFVISEFILLIGIALVSSMGVTYRREQLLNTKINETAQITADTTKEKNYKIFPKSYNPMKNYYHKVFDKRKKMLFDWMPDFHIIFSRMFLVIQLFLILIYFVKLAAIFSNPLALNNQFIYHSLFFVLGILCFPISLRIIKIYHNKLLDFYLSNGMQELKENRYKNGE